MFYNEMCMYSIWINYRYRSWKSLSMFMTQNGSSPDYPVYDYLLINEIDENSNEKLNEKPIEELDKKFYKEFN